jgi:hypothetical protein
VSTYRYSVMLIAPVIALSLLVGKPVLGFLLGSDFRGHDAERLVITLVCLIGWVLGNAAGLYAVVELLSSGRARALAAVATAQSALLVGLAVTGRELGGIEGVAVGQSLSMLAGTATQLRLAFAGAWLSTLRAIGGATATGIAVAAAATAPGLILLGVAGDSAATRIAAAASGLALALVVTRLAWRGESTALMSFVVRPRQAP